MPATNAQLTRIRLGDAPQAWADAGFHVAGDTVRLGATVVELSGRGGAFAGWSIEGVVAPLDGLPTIAPVPATPDRTITSPDHPNGISRIDHVVVRSDDCDRTVEAFRLAGLEVHGGRSTTSYGEPMRQVFFWAGDVIIELIGPAGAEADQPSSAPGAIDEGEQQRSDRDDVDRGGTASIFGLALVAEDLDATADHLGELLGHPKDAVQPGRRIAGLRGRTVGMSLPIAVMSPHVRPEGDPQATDR